MVNERYQKEWRPQTVSTYLAHLVQKEFLKMTRKGKIYTYHPLVAEKDYREKEMNNFVDFWGGGSPAAFLSAFMDSNELKEDEMEELRHLIDGMDQ